MVDSQTRVAFARWPNAPTAGQTIILYASHARAPGGVGAELPASTLVPGVVSRQVGPEDIQAVTLLFLKHNQLSAASGVRAYAWSSNSGLWREIDIKDQDNVATIGAAAPLQIPVLSSGQECKERFDVATYEGICFEYTAGLVAPTEWDGSIALHINSASVGL